MKGQVKGGPSRVSTNANAIACCVLIKFFNSGTARYDKYYINLSSYSFLCYYKQLLKHRIKLASTC